MADKRGKYRSLPLFLVSFSLSLLGAGAFALVRGMRKGVPGKPRKVVREMQIRKPPPPPDVLTQARPDVLPPASLEVLSAARPDGLPPQASDVVPPLAALDELLPAPCDETAPPAFDAMPSPQADVPPAFSVALSPEGFFVVTPSALAFDVPLPSVGFCVARRPAASDIALSPAAFDVPPPDVLSLPRVDVLPPPPATVLPRPRPDVRRTAPRKDAVIEKAKKYRYLPLILLSISVSLLGVGAYALIRGIVSGAPGQAKKVVQEIHVIRPPPPPPDLPPPPPPPPEEKVSVPDPQKQEPDPTPSNEPPPSEQLGLDAEGTAGGDAFGLLGNKGGHDLIASGSGSVFAWYAGLVKGEIQEQLSENQELRKGNYKVSVQLWIRPDGGVDHARVLKSSGDPKRDRIIIDEAARIRFSKPPPSDWPQPLTFEMDGHG